jgi:hypothetical protein
MSKNIKKRNDKEDHSFSIVMVTSHLVTLKVQRSLGRWRRLLPCEWGIFIYPFLYFFASEETGVSIPDVLLLFVYTLQAGVSFSESSDNRSFVRMQLWRVLQIAGGVFDWHEVSAVEFMHIQGATQKF